MYRICRKLPDPFQEVCILIEKLVYFRRISINFMAQFLESP